MIAVRWPRATLAAALAVPSRTEPGLKSLTPTPMVP
jgi:hypothetical protein